MRGIKILFTLGILALSLAGCGLPATIQEGPAAQQGGLFESGPLASASDYIMVYDQENYQGTSLKITTNTPRLSTLGWDNRIRSVRTNGNCLAVLFEDNYYSSYSSTRGWYEENWGDGARYVDTNGSDPGANLGYMSGQASSIAVLWKGVNGNQPGWLKEDVAITGRDDSTDLVSEWKLYLCADANLDQYNPPVGANRYLRGPWEEFELYWLDAEKTYFALKAKTNGKYVSCDFGIKSTGNYRAKLVANRDALRLWEMFALQNVKQTGANYIYSRIAPVRYKRSLGSRPARNETFLSSEKRCDASVINQHNDIGMFGWVPDQRAYLFRIQMLTPVQNAPLTIHPYTADPSAHVFNNKLYLYCSHDTDIATGFGMEDYYVYSMDSMSSPLRHYYELNGPALGIQPGGWYKSQLWAPDAAQKGSSYYLYFPARAREQVNGYDVFRIGVASSASPYGAFAPEASYLKGPNGSKSYSIDPCVFNDNGTYYMYFGGLWGGQLEKWNTAGTAFNPSIPEQQPSDAISCKPRVVRLSADMKSMAEAPREITIYDSNGSSPLKANQTDKRFFEASWMTKVGGTYYFSYSTGDTHYLVYATSTSPYGPFTYRGRLLEPVGGWTTHHSIVQFGSAWYLFYHDNEISQHDLEKRNVKFKQITFPPL